MSKRNIPSEEDFRRAKMADRERNRGLSEVCEHIMKCFKRDGVYEVFLFFSPRANQFGAYVFYRWERQIKEAEESRLTDRIKDAIYEELENVGRGSRDAIKVVFEFDSHENVEKNYEGDYFLRLR